MSPERRPFDLRDGKDLVPSYAMLSRRQRTVLAWDEYLEQTKRAAPLVYDDVEAFEWDHLQAELERINR